MDKIKQVRMPEISKTPQKVIFIDESQLVVQIRNHDWISELYEIYSMEISTDPNISQIEKTLSPDLISVFLIIDLTSRKKIKSIICVYGFFLLLLPKVLIQDYEVNKVTLL